MLDRISILRAYPANKSDRKYCSVGIWSRGAWGRPGAAQFHVPTKYNFFSGNEVTLRKNMRSGFDAWREIRVFSRAVPHLGYESGRWGEIEEKIMLRWNLERPL